MHGRGAVAVVAVHGVGVHTPGDMARDIAALVQGANPQTYSPFACSLLEVAVERPVGMAAAMSSARPPSGPKPWYVRSAFVSRKVSEGPASEAPITDDIRFTQQAVEGARIDSALSTYRTVLLRGERALSGHAAPCMVDIYELSWSDLSHLGGFFARVMGEFYQILFHVASLGQKTVELAWSRAEAGSADKRSLGFLLRAQTITEWLLAGVIPVLSLALLLAVLPLMPILFLELGDRQALAVYLLATIVGFAIFVWLTQMLVRRRTESEARAPRYARVLGAAAWCGLLAAGLAQGDLITVTARVAEGLYALLALAWILFMVFAIATCIAGGIASFLSTSRRTKAAVWTGKIGIVVPASLLFIMNTLGWRYLANSFDQRAMPVADALDAAIGAGFAAFVACIAVAMLLIVVALLPSIVDEIRPPAGNSRQESGRLGRWLDRGIVLSRVAGYVALAGLLVVLPGLELVAGESDDEASRNVVNTLSGLILGSAAVAITFRKAVLGGVTKAIGIMLDVDNWLKERPLEVNPRGRILLRYMALLRYIATRGYEHVVIVSHSQGTAISADLLRYLRVFPDRSIALADIRLMTFGSPLRQLYGARFPHLYDWARQDPVTAAIPDPTMLHGVTRWINGYRSGDYVGRFFWTANDPWTPSTFPANGSGEFCLGAGAHTHYFDNTALMVGRAIDGAIAA